MKQSDLKYFDNSKTCVFCVFGDFEFYWERRFDVVLVKSLDKFQPFETKIYLPKLDKSTSSDARKEIVKYLEASFNV